MGFIPPIFFGLSNGGSEVKPNPITNPVPASTRLRVLTIDHILDNVFFASDGVCTLVGTVSGEVKNIFGHPCRFRVDIFILIVLGLSFGTHPNSNRITFKITILKTSNTEDINNGHLFRMGEFRIPVSDS